MPWELVLGGTLVVFLIIYALTAGADFGGGMWDLFARGKTANEERRLISRSIGPIWEANHVWLIAVVVVLFVCFPKAFAAVSTGLHIPLTLLLIGIVLRGTAFVFRGYDEDEHYKTWSLVFAVGSLISPLMLGVVIGTLAAGDVRFDEQGVLIGGFFAGWMKPFPWVLGGFVVVLFAYLAAVYLAVAAGSSPLSDVFRKKAMVSAVILAVVAWLCFFTAAEGAPVLAAGLSREAWSLSLQVLVASTAVGAFYGLWVRRFRLARFFAAAQVVFIILGWAFSVFPYLIVGEMTVADAAAAESILAMTFYVLLIGSVLLFPSMYYLFHVFHLHQEKKARMDP